MLNVSEISAFTSPKMLDFDAAQRKIGVLKSQGKTVGLCHGGFDLLHPGHIKHFESAKQLCDVLLVSVTSDRFVAGRKGAGRPVFTERLRAYSIAALECVDYVVVTDVEKAVPILEILKPSYYIKGPDFMGKSTPGITAEREAIARVGGEMKYTTDVKLSTTEIIEYVKHQLDVPQLLVVIDRDGTLIEDVGFLGKNQHWRDEIVFKEEVMNYLAYVQTKYATTKVVATNQGGVARRFYDHTTIRDIHQVIKERLATKGITIHSWQYCPDVDQAYAAAHPELNLDAGYVKESTRRKPNPTMVLDALRELGKDIGGFSKIVVLGDREEDLGLAKNLNGTFIDVKGKSVEEMKKEFA